MKVRFPFLFSRCEQDTFNMGRIFAGHVYKGLALVLDGDLGAGKTRFVQGLGLGLGVSNIKSPTYAIEAIYEMGSMPLVHVDLYRRGENLQCIQLDEYLCDGFLVVVEWGVKWLGKPTEDLWCVELKYLSDDERVVNVEAYGDKASKALNEAYLKCLLI
jgi:tRNA threonylcarbamoyladenosine biosynthesis protein TsaE